VGAAPGDQQSQAKRREAIMNKQGTIAKILAIGLTISLAGPLHAQHWPKKKPIPPTLGAARQYNWHPNNRPPVDPWTPLTNQPSFLIDGAANPILLTDGTVLVQDAGEQDWWRLTPDQSGSYVNGTWTQIASLPAGYSPLYHSSAVLPDGRLIIEGGEYNFFNAVWTAQGAIYDPIANTWTPVAPPPFFSVIEIVPGVFGQTIGDASSVVLANGTYMQSDCCTDQAALLDAKTLTWTPTGTGKFDPNNEEGWTLLGNNRVLTVDAYVPIPPFPYLPTGTNSEVYNPKTGSWTSAGSTIVQLLDSAIGCGGLDFATFEVGPAILRSDGTVFYTGSNTCANGAGNTAIYNSYWGTWTPGPVFPVVDGITDLNIADGPASWEPNDKVLMMASPGFGNPPSVFFEWDGHDLNVVPGPPNAPIDGSFFGNMLVLPTGQILLTDFSNDIEIYTPTMRSSDWRHQERFAPVIFEAPKKVAPGGSYEISGILFNGVTLGAAYGDDVQAATNFPLVRITNLKTRHVFYARTHDHSSMAVASDQVVSTHFNVSGAQEPGPSKLEVVANGVASAPVVVHVQ
jgi:hypothetical protein